MARSKVRARSAEVRAVLAAAVLCVIASPAAAEVRVTDAGDGALTVEAHDATVREILDALGKTSPIRFQESEALSRHVTGTYTGPVRRVLSRILDGYDHVIRSTGSEIQIDVVGAAQVRKVAGSGGPTMAAPPGRAGPRMAPRVSSNVDADEEATQSKPAPPRGPQTVNLVPAPHSSAPPAVQPSRAARIDALRPRVSSNVDADEETAQ